MKKTKIIGISGLARSGKNLFGDILQNQLMEKGYNAATFALANALKGDCEYFLREKCGFNVWTNDTEEKSKFRPILVEYGKIQRQRTKGTYWTNILRETILEYPDLDFAIVTDIRYAEYEHDEVQWVQKEMGGKLIHILKYSMTPSDSDEGDDKLYKTYINPPNEDERINDPKVRSLSDVPVEWEHKDTSMAELLVDPYLNGIVADAIKKLGYTK